ncbi:hypothetical protein FisN_6Lh024 [Fistulifera solaris]|uniref:Protein MAK10 homolog n=1 Tax=Fistulifera solaris TaxID=1519565 RepID=A0A1Z5KPX0_FISSO|nr:hypothetical protein FisN_6Lh024 [Fistulifera solaris]|eukprot:GAX28152.1 hypothetical protein FisN_6Lh024 [Fistulifera solaris]
MMEQLISVTAIMNQDDDLRHRPSDKEKASFFVASSLPSSHHLFEDLIPSAKSSLIDVTHFFQQCAQQLTPEHAFLCHEEIHFNLYDAMAASQLGHEKMDCCQVPPYRVTTTEEPYVFPRPPPTGLSSAFTTLLWDEWTETQVLGFAVQILVRLQALCTGASVGESTFTCLYAHAPVLQEMEERLFPLELSLSEQWNVTNDASQVDTDDKTLSYHGTPEQFMIYALSLSLSEITKVFRSIVHNADIYEEEDYVAQTYQIPLYTSRHQDFVTVFRTAMNVFHELSEVQAALGLILSFLMGFYSSMAQLAKLSTNGILDQVQGIQTIVVKAVDALDLLLEQPSLVSVSAPSTAFDPYVYRPRVGNTPVRQVRTVEPRQAIEVLREITHEMDWSVCQLLLKANSLGRLRRMLQHVSRKDVNILSRSLIVLNLYFDDLILGQFSMAQWIWEDLLEWTTVLEDSNLHFLQTEHCHSFLQRLAKPIYDTLKLQTLNRNRHRAFMDVIMFPEWVSLQMEAQALDGYLCSEGHLQSSTPIFTQYTLVATLRLMVQYITVGFELDLYCSHDDIGFAYWYLDFLLSGLLTHLSAMKQNKDMANMEQRVKESKTLTLNGSNKGNQRNKKKNQRQKNNAPEVAPSYRPTPQDLETDFELSVLALKRNLCRGSLRFLAALQQAGILKERKHIFTSKERVFQERFRAFAGIRQPPPLVYKQYAQGSDFSTVTTEELQQSTSEWFLSCRRAVEHLQSTALPSVDVDYAPIRETELNSLLKVCIGNNVYLMKLRQAIQDPKWVSSVRVEFETKTHDQFCTIKLS